MFHQGRLKFKWIFSHNLSLSLFTWTVCSTWSTWFHGQLSVREISSACVYGLMSSGKPFQMQQLRQLFVLEIDSIELLWNLSSLLLQYNYLRQEVMILWRWDYGWILTRIWSPVRVSVSDTRNRSKTPFQCSLCISHRVCLSGMAWAVPHVCLFWFQTHLSQRGGNNELMLASGFMI